MYCRWEPEYPKYRGRTVQARLRPFADRWFDIDLTDCEPIGASIPILEFDWDARVPLSDMLYSASRWYPLSSRLVSLISSLGVRFETFQSRIYEAGSGDLLSDDYSVAHILECHNCVDLSRSEYEPFVAPSGALRLLGLRSIVPTRACTEAAYPLFRVAEARHIVLAHVGTIQLFSEQNVTGSRFLPIAGMPSFTAQVFQRRDKNED
jgi:hypothetical protein